MFDWSQAFISLLPIAFVALLVWQIGLAILGGPDWQSGRSTDTFRFSRWEVIVGGAVSLGAVAVVLQVTR